MSSDPGREDRRRKRAPGPMGLPILGNLLDFRRNVLDVLLDSRTRFGDVVRFTLGSMVYHLVAHPDQIEYVLLTNHRNFNKDTRSSAKIRSVTGDGLLTSNGDFWLRQRRRWQPAFLPAQVPTYINTIVESVCAMLERWTNYAARDQAVDIASEMMRVTCSIVARAILGSDVDQDLPVIEESATVLMGNAWKRLQRLVDSDLLRPPRETRRLKQATLALDGVVTRIIEQRRQATHRDTSDLLGQLLLDVERHERDSMSDQQLRNEIVTVLLAGHETTANSLAWCWYCLAKHPDVADRVRAEVDAVCGSKPPTRDEIGKLIYIAQVYRETLRLYPPIWIMERRVLSEDRLSDYVIPEGSSVVVCPWVTHRHPQFWHNADQFNPDRFAIPNYDHQCERAFLPFGLGQRYCVGSELATLEAVFILAMVAQRFRLELAREYLAIPQPGITLRIKGGLPMRVHLRDPR